MCLILSLVSIKIEDPQTTLLFCRIFLGWHIDSLLCIFIFSDELNRVCYKYLKLFVVVIDVSQNNLGISPELFLVDGSSQLLSQQNDNLTDAAAAVSSSLGMEIYFKGLSIDSPIRKTQ